MGERAADRTLDSGQGAPGSMTAREAATRLGVGERTIRRAIARGDLPAAKWAGVYWIAPADLAAYRAGHAVEGDRGGVMPAPITDLPPAPPWLRFVPPIDAGPAGSAVLPVPLTPLVGREREVAEARAALLRPDVRLVTLTGPGGVGKTRLALAVAAGGDEAFADGVRFVPLAAVADPDLVLPAIAAALGLREGGERSAEVTLRAALCGRHLLLVLDNFEQVVGAAPMVAELLAECPEVTTLVTSRTRLRLRGERVLPVLPLPAPDPGDALDAAAVRGYPSVQLFLQRGRDVRPDFALTTENAAALAAICRRLDGLPLAIELAAARLDVLSPEALLVRLERQLALLTGGARDLPERLRTMRAAIAWSHDLLVPEERQLFRRLAVFVGGWTLEAAEAVGESLPGTPPVFDALSALVDAALVRRTTPDDGDDPRFDMLATIRDYALEQLAAGGEVETARTAHANYFLALAEEAEPHLEGEEPAAWMARLRADRDNLRAALAWLAEAGDAERGLRLAGALWRFWYLSGNLSGWFDWTRRALARSTDASAARAKAVLAAGLLAVTQGGTEEALALTSEGLGLSRALGDRAGAAMALYLLALANEGAGRYDPAARHFEEALASFQDLGDRYWTGFTLGHLGLVAWGQGDLDGAAARCDAGLALHREVGHPFGIAFSLTFLGHVAQARGDRTAAVAAYAEALALWQDQGAKEGFILTLSGVASLAATGRPAVAARLFGAAEALREETGRGRRLPEQALYDRAAAAARTALGEAAFAAAWAAGRALPLEAAVHEAEAVLGGAVAVPAMIGPVSATGEGGRAGLTPREREVLRLVAAGRSDREIGAALFISHRTAMTHVANILAKLGVPSRAAAARAAADRGLL